MYEYLLQEKLKFNLIICNFVVIKKQRQLLNKSPLLKFFLLFRESLATQRNNGTTLQGYWMGTPFLYAYRMIKLYIK